MSFTTQTSQPSLAFARNHLILSNENNTKQFFLEEENNLILPLKYSTSFPLEKREPSTPLSFSFKGQLRTDQKVVADEAFELLERERNVFLDLPTNWGKCLEENTKVLLLDGSKKKVKDLSVGELLVGDDGSERRILSLISFSDSIFKLKYGRKTRLITRDHILTIVNQGEVVDVRADQVDPTSFLFFKKMNPENSFIVDYKPIMNKSEKAIREIILKMSASCKWFLYLNLCSSSYQKKESRIMRFLCRCLGIGVERERKGDVYYHKETKDGDLFKVPFSLEPVRGKMRCVGFTLTGNGRFLLGDNIVTHNTTLGIYVACVYRVPTAIVTYSDKVRSQWKDRIQQFSTADVRLLKEKGSLEADIVVCGIIESLSHNFDHIKLLIIDEAHQSPLSLYTQVIFNFRWCERLIGMTATPRCNAYPDIFKVIFSSPFISRFQKKEFIVYKYITGIKPTNIKRVWIKGKVRDSWTSVVESLSLNPLKARIVAEICKKKEGPEGRTLVLCDRLDQIHLICSFLEDGSFDKFYGSMKDYGEQPIIVAEERKGGVGLDDHTFTRLIRAFDNRYPEQNIGRIRVDNNIVYDLVDCYGPCYKHWELRETWYRKKGATIIQV
jgi:hypothetical protein